MNQQTQNPTQETKQSKPRKVTISVNGKAVEVPVKVTGAEIKAAAGVPGEFDLFRVKGRKEIPVADGETVSVKKGDKFIASPTLDPSFPVAAQFDTEVDTVREAFPGSSVTVESYPDGSAMVSVNAVSIGEGWNFSEIDLAVKLLVTFPSTPPYPFYGPEGMVRSNGTALAPIQPASIEGRTCTQISLNKPFDPSVETLGARFAAVARWLKDPR